MKGNNISAEKASVHIPPLCHPLLTLSFCFGGGGCCNAAAQESDDRKSFTSAKAGQNTAKKKEISRSSGLERSSEARMLGGLVGLSPWVGGPGGATADGQMFSDLQSPTRGMWVWAPRCCSSSPYKDKPGHVPPLPLHTPGRHPGR